MERNEVDYDARDATDVQKLHEMGYLQEMPRSLGLISMIGLGLGITAPLLAVPANFLFGYLTGGPVTLNYGYLFWGFNSIATAFSIAEIAAKYPTAGAYYHYAYTLAPPRFAAITSYINGWILFSSYICAQLVVTFVGAETIMTSIAIWNPNFDFKVWQTLTVFWVINLLSFLVNVLAAKWLYILDWISVFWNATCFVVIIIALLVGDRHNLNSGTYVFATFENLSGWADGWAWFIGLIAAAGTLAPFGQVASMAEEARNPSHTLPRAIVWITTVLTAMGWIITIIILAVVPGPDSVTEAAQGLGAYIWFMNALGTPGGGQGILLLIIISDVFAIVGIVTTGGRFTYAFARDKALPFSDFFSKVDPRFRVPIYAQALNCIIVSLLGCIDFGSTAAFLTFLSVGSIVLCQSYALPIILSLIDGRRKVQSSPYPLGRFGYIINVWSAIWMSMGLVIFCFPLALPVTAASMNWSSVLWVGFAGFAFVYYMIRARHRFIGPEALVKISPDQLDNEKAHHDRATVIEKDTIATGTVVDV